MAWSEEARRASVEARKASAKAKASGKPGDHEAAATAHNAAAVLHTKAAAQGVDVQSDYDSATESKAAEHHEAMADKHVAKAAELSGSQSSQPKESSASENRTADVAPKASDNWYAGHMAKLAEHERQVKDTREKALAKEHEGGKIPQDPEKMSGSEGAASREAARATKIAKDVSKGRADDRDVIRAHENAANAHAHASELHAKAGNQTAADHHEKMASLHQKKVSDRYRELQSSSGRKSRNASEWKGPSRPGRE